MNWTILRTCHISTVNVVLHRSTICNNFDFQMHKLFVETVHKPIFFPGQEGVGFVNGSLFKDVTVVFGLELISDHVMDLTSMCHKMCRQSRETLIYFSMPLNRTTGEPSELKQMQSQDMK